MKPGNPISSMPTRGPLEGSHAYLTFDDGPDPQWTPRLLDALAQAGVRATFFVIGEAARRSPDLVRRTLAEGHGIGNHTWSHRHPWLMSERAARREVRDGAAAIADVTGRQAALFRPPHGRVRRCMIEEAQHHGQSLVLWSRSAIDWGPFGHAGSISRRLDAIRPGDIVLMHDGQRSSNRPQQLLQVLPALLARMKARGLESVPVEPTARH